MGIDHRELGGAINSDIGKSRGLGPVDQAIQCVCWFHAYAEVNHARMGEIDIEIRSRPPAKGCTMPVGPH
jgi:hypothetical protein